EQVSGDKPTARGAGKWVPVGNELVMFGGFMECFDKTKCEHQYFDDVYTFDVTANKWEKKNPTPASGKLPGKRVFIGAAPYRKKNTAILFGGARYDVNLKDVHVYDDLWEYDPAKDVMTQRTYANQGPGARLGAEIAIKDDKVYLFGGFDNTF